MSIGAPEDEANWQRVESPNAPAYWTYTKPIQKSEQDDREYRVIRLDNGLQAVLVHDAKADKAAASLDVAVGHLDDPDDMPGLAHFCEHLLFMGTEQYPKENEYSEFLAKNNGHSNAFTAASNTNYYFSVGPSALSGALARFSGFFHSPLFAPSCTMRELNAVDSENKKNLQNDIWRIYQVSKSLSKPGHPWSKFGSGNKQSLTEAGRKLQAEGLLNSEDRKKQSAPAAHVPSQTSSLEPSPIPSPLATPISAASSATSEAESETDGGAIGRETRRRLVEWWSNEYCAGRMRLCIIGKESVEELSGLAATFFSPIKNRGQDPAPMISDHPFGEAEKGTLLAVQTIMGFHVLELCLPMEYQPPQWRYKVSYLLGDLVGHEGPGSLHSYLKHKGWMSALNAGPQLLARGFAMFKVTIHLTEDGFKNHREVASACFKYLSLLRSTELPDWYQKEISAISNIRFRFSEKRRPEDYAISLTDYLLWPMPRELILKAPAVTSEWDTQGEARALYNRTLDSYRVKNARSILMARKSEHDKVAGPQTWETEPWYGTPYRVERFDDDFLTEAEGPNTIPALHFPRPNEFIPTNFDVEKRDVAEPQRRPHLIHATPHSTLWHKKDDHFWVPKARVIIELRNPVANESPVAAVLTKLFAELVSDSLTEYSYDASVAGLDYHFAASTLGIFIIVNGYNDKLHVLLRNVVEKVKNLEIRADRLEVMKEQACLTKRDWENFFLEQTYRLSDYYGRYLMTEKQWTIQEKLKALPSITVEHVQKHSASLLSELNTRILVAGNMYKDEALRLAKMTEEMLSASPLSTPEADLSLLLPEGSNFVWTFPVPNPSEPNSALTYYVHLGDLTDRHLRVTAALLTQILKEPAFDTLRTKEQLGYIVSASAWPSAGDSVTGLHIVVQSERGPVYLEERVEAFLEKMKGVIIEMSEDEFLEQKNGLEQKWREAPKNLAEETQRYWSHIDSGYLDFYRRVEDADFVKTITKADVLALFLSRVDPASATRSKLSVHGRSQKPRSKHVSRAASIAFELLAKQEGIAVDSINWRGELSSSGEPAVSEFSNYWKKALLNTSTDVIGKLFAALPGLIEKHPAERDADGTLRAGVVHIDDVAAFRKSLAISEYPKPLVAWNDIPTAKF
ncbi:hypothetical protein BV25DRAFT_1804109 [Artomyces pyxidatus]|uniref:Uncharacterized protein n=1 Tax=Artomyces pyxidatus TaxID=48021 RepID=A0ACB8T0A6_9AGAM|nr:hypothetical protein BV25DRAFT_1804109 [Artomyces pyxidatus]